MGILPKSQAFSAPRDAYRRRYLRCCSCKSLTLAPEASSPPVPSPSEIRPPASEFEAGFQPTSRRVRSVSARTSRAHHLSSPNIVEGSCNYSTHREFELSMPHRIMLQGFPLSQGSRWTTCQFRAPQSLQRGRSRAQVSMMTNAAVKYQPIPSGTCSSSRLTVRKNVVGSLWLKKRQMSLKG